MDKCEEIERKEKQQALIFPVPTPPWMDDHKDTRQTFIFQPNKCAGDFCLWKYSSRELLFFPSWFELPYDSLLPVISEISESLRK